MSIKVAIVVILILFLGMVGYQYLRYFDGKLHVVFCDVGQGDAMYIRTPSGIDMVVDGGPDDSVLDCLSEYRPFWDRSIEVMYATHPDADHITGLVPILRRFRVRSIITSKAEGETEIYKEFTRLVAEEKGNSFAAYSQDQFKTRDGVLIHQLWPARNTSQLAGRSVQTTNSQSLVQLLRYKDFEVLLTGDVDVEILNAVIENLPDVDVFKLAHHGSRTGTDSLTFKDVQPNLVIMSLGVNNRYGHPHQEVMRALQMAKLPVKRTDKNGNVEIITDGKTTRVVTEK